MREPKPPNLIETMKSKNKGDKIKDDKPKNLPTREQKVATGHTVRQFTCSYGAVLSR